MTVSPNNQLLAYAADTVGGEKYAIWVKELATGRQLLRSPIPVRRWLCAVRHCSTQTHLESVLAAQGRQRAMDITLMGEC